ncbi:MAG TPA: hypothetical protein VE076_04225 [Nitrososphaeraceae archaeon]|nr:hypothetical protein [Nitrososphaeraceae archaeon]
MDYRGRSRLIFGLVAVLIASLILDTIISKVYYFSFSQSPLTWRIVLFIVIGAVFMSTTYFISDFVRNRSKEIRALDSLHIASLDKLTAISRYLLTFIIGVIIFEMLVTTRYNVYILALATWISYTTGISMMVLLASQFLLWFKSNKHVVVLFYGLSSAVLAINLCFILAFVTAMLMNTSAYSEPHIAYISPFINLGPLGSVLTYGYQASSIASFMIWWIGTVFILQHYSGKGRRKRSWIILSLPLFYFLIQFQPLFLNIFSTFLESEPVLFSTLYTLAFTLSKPIGGILFSLVFLSIAKKIGDNDRVKKYIIISAFGLVLVFVSNQATVLVSAPYPPFGLATISSLALGSYLVVVGIYSSALSVAQDSNLRKTIRQYTLNEAKLLDNIGTAVMENELQRRVMKITKQHRDVLTQQTGIESTFSDDDAKNYLHEVMEEIHKGSIKH